MNGLLGPTALYVFALRAAAVLLVIPFHEAAHALVSWLLGDPTAKNAGRLSLNPLRHFDWMGTLCMVLGGVGWARPVGIDVRRFRSPKRDMALSAAAGPAANLLLAFVGLILYKYLAVWYYAGGGWAVALDFLSILISLNISLAVFNLLPIPPFDGSRIFLLFLPRRLYFRAMQYERYMMIAVLLLVVFGFLDRPLSFLVDRVWRLLDAATFFAGCIFVS